MEIPAWKNVSANMEIQDYTRFRSFKNIGAINKRIKYTQIIN